MPDNENNNHNSVSSDNHHNKEKERILDMLQKTEQKIFLLGELLRVKDYALKKMKKTQYLIIMTATITIFLIIAGYSFYITSLAGHEHKIVMDEKLRSFYIIQNLEGEVIDTWLIWNIPQNGSLHISLVGLEKYPEKLEIVNTVINSEEDIQIDNSLVGKNRTGLSTYYVGWKGAAKAAASSIEQEKQTGNKTGLNYTMPSDFIILDRKEGVRKNSTSPPGDIVVVFTDKAHEDGYLGLTKSTAKENQIVKSRIIIYSMDELTDKEFETVLRHEFGHAIGLAHASDPNDLMHTVVLTNYPYISNCDVEALKELYSGSQKSEIICKD